MNVQVDTCAWKMVPSDKFVLGQDAERCGEVAEVKILRPQRKTDLFLCEHHLNAFIKEWGLHYEVEILCLNWLEGENQARFLNSHNILRRDCRHGRPECECDRGWEPGHACGGSK